MQLPRLRVCTSIFAVGVLFAACGDSDTSDGTTTGAVGAEGGEVSSSGVLLEVPSGALAVAADIEIALVADLEAAGYAAVPAFASDVVAAVELTPHGLTFDKPVAVTIPYTGATENVVVMVLDGPDDTEWEAVAGPVTFDADGIHFEVNHFSLYSAVTIAAGACPCWSGADLVAFRDATAAAGLQLRSYAPGGFMATTTGRWASVAGNINGGGSCVLASTTPAQFASFFPRFTAGVAGGTTLFIPAIGADAVTACSMLARNFAANVVGAQVGFAAPGLPAGETVGIRLVGGDLVNVDTATEVFWSPFVAESGTAYEFVVETQPASATCTLSANATGTAGTDNVVIDVDCGTSATGGCTATVDGSGSVPDVTLVGDCQFGESATDFEGFFLLDAPLGAGFSMEEVSAWQAFAGNAVVGLSLGDGATAGVGSGSARGEGSVIAGPGLGVWSGDETFHDWSITAFDATAQTFRMEVTFSNLIGTTLFPPAERAPAGSGRVDFPDTGSATVVLEGAFTYP